jgi:hypothetical protein
MGVRTPGASLRRRRRPIADATVVKSRWALRLRRSTRAERRLRDHVETPSATTIAFLGPNPWRPSELYAHQQFARLYVQVTSARSALDS